MDLLDIAKVGAKNSEYKDIVQVIKDGPKLKDHFIQKFIHYKKGARKRTNSHNSP